MFTVRVSEARPIGSMLLRGMGCLVSAVFCIQATANKSKGLNSGGYGDNVGAFQQC